MASAIAVPPFNRRRRTGHIVETLRIASVALFFDGRALCITAVRPTPAHGRHTLCVSFFFLSN